MFRLRPVAAGIAMAVPFGAVTNAVMNHVFVTGGFLLDTGWFVHLVAMQDWPLSNPPLIGGTYFATHLTLLFHAVGAIERVLPIGPIATFALSQGLWSALIALAVVILAKAADTQHTRNDSLTNSLVAAGTALSGPVLLLLGFPHPEIALPALILLSVALWLRGWTVVALAVLALGLAVREDAGLHAATVYGAIGLCRVVRAGGGRGRFAEVGVAAGAALAAGALMAYQRWAFAGDDALARMYLEDPMLAHVDAGFVGRRLWHWVTDRADVVAPLAVLLAWALAVRRPAPAMGVLAVAPWLALHAIAVEDAPGRLLDNYGFYGFPLLIAVGWPLVAAAVDPALQGRRAWRATAVQVLTVGLSIALLPMADPGLKDRRSWRVFDVAYTGTVGATKRFMAAHRADPTAAGFVLMGDGVAALMPELVGGATWLPGNAPVDGLGRWDTVMVFDRGPECREFAEVLRAPGPHAVRRVTGTHILLITRRPPSALPYRLNSWAPPDGGDPCR